MEQDKYTKSHRQSRKDKSKDKSNSFFGSQKHIRIKTNIIEKLQLYLLDYKNNNKTNELNELKNLNNNENNC
jgi:hypothetical protein